MLINIFPEDFCEISSYSLVLPEDLTTIIEYTDELEDIEIEKLNTQYRKELAKLVENYDSTTDRLY